MTKTRSTKRALVLSALAILMCVSMLVGSTFAWFTDSVTSARNQIVSGNLDVELYYSTWDAENNTWTEYAEVNATTKIFDENALYEPGYTEVVRFQVKNAGSLALKYNMTATVYSEEAGINVYNQPFNLSDYIYTGKIDVADAADRATAAAKATEKLGTGLNVAAGSSLLAGASEEFALVLTMPTTVGNEANHLDGHQPSIQFGIALVATQFTYESDDFGPDYDILAGETHFMANGVNYASFDEAVKNATPDANGVVTYFINGEAVFSGGWNAPIAPAGTTKVVIKGTGADTASLNLANTYRNSLHADGMVVEISDITIDCDPCGTHQDQRNVWVCADELYATNVVFMDPADASNVKVAVFDGCTFASATADEEPSGGNYQLWVGDHDANYGSVTESVVVKNSVFQSGRRAIKLAPTTGSASYTAVIDNNTFYDITYKPAVCLNYGDQANTVTITNNTLYNTALVEDEVNGNYTESNNKLITVATVSTADDLANALATADKVVLSADITGVDANTAITVAAGKDVTLDLNGHKLTATADKTGNQELFLVKGTMTVMNGSLEIVAQNNQGWNAMATIFDVTAGGVLKIDNVTANVAGTDMNFFVHLNNWGSATLEMTNCDITTTYVAVRAFNSGYDMNTITIKDCDFHNGRMFWVHNYTSEGKDDTTLTLDIYGNNNTSDNAKPVRFGFSDSTYYDIDGNLIP